MRAEQVRGSDAQARFARAGRECGGERLHAGGEAKPRAAWASATFVGEQLSMTVRVEPVAAARAWIEGLPEADLPMRGYVAMPPAIDRVEEGTGLEVALTCLVLVAG